MADPTTRAELLEKIQKGHHEFEELLAPLSEAQLTTPGVSEDWSIKDILAHLAAWQGRVANRLEALARQEDYQPVPQIDNDEEMNKFNGEVVLASRSRSLAEVCADFRTNYQRICAGIELLNEPDFFDGQRFHWLDGEPFWKNIEGNTFGHYEEHAPAIEAWLAQQEA